ncbi:MAG: uracil-DNA glycosylase [Fimbriiglobus sp.]|jgi:uracil-DNA glycosylase|nr:uracil-DNA glycosylase [Fimbriiglobus sp.]
MAKDPKQPPKAPPGASLFDHDSATPHVPMDAVDQLLPKFDIEKAVIPRDFPASWVAAVGEEFTKPYFADLRRFVTDERKQHHILPDATDVMNAFRATPLEIVRVVILGQDPYPTPGHAHGLCFSVRRGVAIPASLRNIYKELHSDLGIPPATHGNLEAWATQGVFLLNTVLTVRAGSPNSHKGKGWEEFTDAALRAVNALPRKVVFLLWGAHAKQKAKLIDQKKHTVITGVHPSPMSADNGFFGSKPFSKVNEALEDAGLPPIDWKLPEV